jgi:hypothetical protein
VIGIEEAVGREELPVALIEKIGHAPFALAVERQNESGHGQNC